MKEGLPFTWDISLGNSGFLFLFLTVFIRYLPSFSFTDHFPHLYAHFFMLLHLTQMQPLKFALALCNCRGKSVFSQMCVGKLLLRHIVLTTFMLIFE